MFEMHFYVTKTKDGLYHVQNAIGPYFGQHHVHTKKGFEQWKKGLAKDRIHVSKGDICCDLKAGAVRDHNGNVTFNEKFV